MDFSKKENILVVLGIIAVLIGSIFFVLYKKESFVFKPAVSPVVKVGAENSDIQVATTSPTPTPIPPPQKLSNPPAIIKAVYVTEYSAGAKSYRNYLTNLFKNTDINAVVVDIKGSDGQTKLYDADSFVRFLHDRNIYVIGRIAVFEDPVFAKARPL